jgi:hypothetical protein
VRLGIYDVSLNADAFFPMSERQEKVIFRDMNCESNVAIIHRKRALNLLYGFVVQ